MGLVLLAAVGCSGSLTLGGTVRDDFQNPIPRAAVEVTPVDETAASSAMGSLQVTADSEGAYAVPGLATGNYRVAGYADGYETNEPEVLLVADGATTHNIIMRKRLTLRAVVYESDGLTPANQATVLITRANGVADDATTERDGRFSTPGFYKGDRYTVRVIKDTRVVELSGQVDDDEEIALTLSGAATGPGTREGELDPHSKQDTDPTDDTP
ncbi:carboxypeptidase regulatory-like domain-containing protein [Candidatus Poribacteria bacterium]|nr:carboxypeptidase regulatory-like domain-containing protein [Candidatus Poribacteria bacterium]